MRSQPVSDTRIVGHIDSNDSGIILHLTQPVLLSAELVRSQPVSDTRIVGHIGSNDSGIISTLRSPLIQQVHHLLINSSLGSLN